MLINTDRSLDKLLFSLRGERRLVVDTETTGLAVWHDDVICGIAIGDPRRARAGIGHYIPFRHELGRNLNTRRVDDVLEVISGAKITTGWNFKFDIHMLDKERPVEWNRVEDVMLGAHLANENEHFMGGNYKLKEWCDTYVAAGSSSKDKELAELLVDRGLGKGDMWRLSGDEVEPYASEDVVLTEKARVVVRRMLKRWALLDIWKEVNEYLLVTVDMERDGMLLDVDRLSALLKEAQKMKRKTHRRLCRLAGYDINPNSSRQINAFLGVDSSRAEVLEDMGDTPEVVAVRDGRAWGKVIGSYYSVYMNKKTEENVLHPNINLHGTVAGRPSASDPNMQAVPRKSHIYKVKEVFIARPGHVLVSMDYSQAELRLAAHVTKDPALMEALKSDDVHQATADQTGIDRDKAKRINFGAVYGIGAASLSKKLKVPYRQAQIFLKMYLGKFKNLRPMRFALEEHAREHKYIRLWTGRVRRYNCRVAEPRKAFSNLIQGGVAEIMRHALTRLHRERKNGSLKGTKILLQVHDQIIFEIPEHLAGKHIPVAKGIMEDFPWLRSPFRVDVSVGVRWSELQPWRPKGNGKERKRARRRRSAVR